MALKKVIHYNFLMCIGNKINVTQLPHVLDIGSCINYFKRREICFRPKEQF